MEAELPYAQQEAAIILFSVAAPAAMTAQAANATVLAVKMRDLLCIWEKNNWEFC